MKRILITAVAGAAALAGSIALAAPAMASNGPQVAVTHLNNHPDTTSASGGAILPGNVWAYDNATEKFTLVQDPSDPSGHTWQVTVDYVGSFHGFADPSGPNAGAALTCDGPVKGTITFTVKSNATPDPSKLPGQSASDAHLTANIAALFGNDSSTAISGGDAYTFSYQNGSYVQNGTPGNNSTGDVTGH
jgi:hypothetical protein